MTLLWILGAIASGVALIRFLDWYFGRKPACDEDSTEVLRAAKEASDKVDELLKQIGVAV